MIARMPSITPRNMIQALERVGFCIHHQTGSHIVLKHEDGRRAVVPNYGGDLKKGTIHSILRSVKLKREIFIDLL